MPDQEKKTRHFDTPLNGKLKTFVDPIHLQPNDLRACTNLRPTDTSPKGILGMTKINASAASYLGVKNGYHFKKDQPTEDHIIVQTDDISGTSSRLVKSDGTTSIPSQDTFSTFKALDNNNRCYFSKSPDGCVAICNGTKNYIWGGDEYRCGAFLVFDPDNTSHIYDYTQVVNNTLTDDQNIATMATVGGGLDADTKGLYHFENDLTDDSGNSHDLTAVGPPTYTTDTTYTVFGTYAAHFAATPLYGRIGGAIGDFDCSGGVWTIDTWLYCTNLSATVGLWSMATDVDNAMLCYVTTTGYLHFKIVAAGAVVVSMESSSPVVLAGRKVHIEIGENGNNYYGFVGGSLVMSTVDAQRPAAYNHASYTWVVGACVCDAGFTGFANYYGDHYLDELRISVGACRHTANFTVQTSAYSASAACNLYIGSVRPLQGIKLYIGTANATAATATGYYWNGSWTALGTFTDNTDTVATKTLSGTGTITWDDTASDAKVKIINNSMAYWYKLAFTGIDATTTVYYCTVDAAIQEIKDIWDGIPRPALSMLTYTTAYADYTLQVAKDDYDSADTGTFVNISDMTSSQYFILGFSEQMMGLAFHFAESYVNTTASTTCTIYYWDGVQWVTVGTLDDGTSQGGISFNRSGIITWDAPSANSEFAMTPNNGIPYHYYKITFDQTIDNSDSKIYLHYVTGIPAQKKLSAYKFPLFWNNRLFLCGDQAGRKNWVKCTSIDTNCFFNGYDSTEFPVDGDDELMCGATLFTRLSGDFYDNMVLFKRTQTIIYNINVSVAPSFTPYVISSSIGCVAPLTLQLCDIGFDISENVKKNVLIWLSSNGLAMFDGVSVNIISDDVKNIFDVNDTTYCINRSYIHLCSGTYDPIEREYHLFYPEGTSTSINAEKVFSLKKQSFFDIDRGTGKALQCAFLVEDSSGNKYVYGGTNDGYVERLEYGQTFDGNDMTFTFWPADINLGEKAMVKTRVVAVGLVGKMKSTSTNKVTATHYVDGVDTGDDLSLISQSKSGYRIYRGFVTLAGYDADGIWHSTKFTVTTDNETRGFEPLLVSYRYEELGDVFE